MDALSHALVGAATGALFSHPFLGAAVAVLPDLVLPIYKRLAAPNTLYRATHSLLSVCCVFGITWVVNSPLAICIASCWLSHILLDLPTHGALWSPRLLWPLSNVHTENFQEWEFCNNSFYIGAVITLLWIGTVITWLHL